VPQFEIRIGEHLPEQPGALQQGKRPTNYSRQSAIDYALFFCNRVCSDGIVMSKDRLNRRRAGELLSDVDPVEAENDCTHFVSCSLGRPPGFKTATGTILTGGGIYISDDGFLDKGKTGVYGILEAGPLVNYLKLTEKIAFAHIDAVGLLFFSGQTPEFFPNTAEQVARLKALIQARFPTDKGKGDLVAYFRRAGRDKRKTLRPHRHRRLGNHLSYGIALRSTAGQRCRAQPVHLLPIQGIQRRQPVRKDSPARVQARSRWATV
jgi:hypothetical protein